MSRRLEPSPELYVQHRILDELRAKTTVTPISWRTQPREGDGLAEIDRVTLSWGDFQMLALEVLK